MDKEQFEEDLKHLQDNAAFISDKKILEGYTSEESGYASLFLSGDWKLLSKGEAVIRISTQQFLDSIEDSYTLSDWDWVKRLANDFYGPGAVTLITEYGSYYNDEYDEDRVTSIQVLDAYGNDLDPDCSLPAFDSFVEDFPNVYGTYLPPLDRNSPLPCHIDIMYSEYVMSSACEMLAKNITYDLTKRVARPELEIYVKL